MCGKNKVYICIVYLRNVLFLRKINEILLFLKKDRSDHLRKVKTLDSVNAATVLSIFLFSSPREIDFDFDFHFFVRRQNQKDEGIGEQARVQISLRLRQMAAPTAPPSQHPRVSGSFSFSLFFSLDSLFPSACECEFGHDLN